MTTGRINQVATIRLKPEAPKRTSTRFAIVCVEFRLRPCISFAIVLYHGSAPASAPPKRRRRESGLCCISTARFNLCSEHRRAALSDAFDLSVWMVEKSNHWFIQLQIRAQVIQSRTSWHSMLKQKKKSEPGGSLIKHLLDVTRKRKPATREVVWSRGKKINYLIILKPTLISKNFFLFLSSASWV